MKIFKALPRKGRRGSLHPGSPCGAPRAVGQAPGGARQWARPPSLGGIKKLCLVKAISEKGQPKSPNTRTHSKRTRRMGKV